MIRPTLSGIVVSSPGRLLPHCYPRKLTWRSTSSNPAKCRILTRFTNLRGRRLPSGYAKRWKVKSEFSLLSVLFLLAAVSSAQDKDAATTPAVIVANAAELHWESDAKDKSESVVLREDPATGAFE